jgi:uncharacterized protein
MQCPVCTGTSLVMAERQGIEIDYCPNCRGVWLDRGELDKIIERAASGRPPQREEHAYPQQERHGHYRDDHHARKKKGFLGELFDFD